MPQGQSDINVCVCMCVCFISLTALQLCCSTAAAKKKMIRLFSAQSLLFSLPLLSFVVTSLCVLDADLAIKG